MEHEVKRFFMTKLNAGLTPSLPISDSDSTAAWGFRRHLKGQPIQARHKQDCGQDFIFLRTQPSLLSGSHPNPSELLLRVMPDLCGTLWERGTLLKGPTTGAFSQPVPWLSLILLLNMTDQSQICQNGRVSIHPNVQRASANRQTCFSGWGNIWKIMAFSGHIANKVRKSTILQLSIEGLNARKMSVFYYLVLQIEAFVILLKKTHCSNAHKLVIVFVWRGIHSRSHTNWTGAEGLSFYTPGCCTAWIRCWQWCY